MRNSLGSLGRRAAAWLIVIAVAVIALKLLAGAVIGFLTMLVGLVALAAVGVAVIWAVRRL